MTGPSTWNGVTNLPQVVNNPTVTVSGYNTSVSDAVELGAGDTPLTFDQPVEVVLAGQGGKLAGWVRNGSFTPIPPFPSNEQPATADTSTDLAALGSNDGYYTDSSNNMVIWTEHFTTFVAYTETPASSSNSGGGSGGAPPALAVTTSSLAAGTVGQSYKETVATNSEGTAPYTFSVTSGTLPPGLALDSSTGELSGTPTTAGTYTFTVTVKDANNNSASESYTLTVNAAAVTQTPAPATPPATPVTLTDIAGNWAYANIEKLVAEGAITGYPNGTFRPGNDITRAEFVTVLVKALKLTPKAGPVFADTENS